MRVLVVDSYYSAFLNSLYVQHPNLGRRAYNEQWRTLMDQCFGTADFYSRNLIALGHEATEVVANCEPLQHQWAMENGVKLASWILDRRATLIPRPRRAVNTDWFYTVLLAQVRKYRPDVLHIQEMNGTSVDFLREVRPYVNLITGQIACTINSHADFRDYDLVLSSLPHYVQNFRNQGLKSELFRLGFESTVLDKLNKRSAPYQVVHVGGYGPIHQERNELLAAIVDHHIPLTCWGYGIELLPRTSPLNGCYQGEAWGLAMYNIRHNSRIVISRHISSVADRYANIMTLYEATGVGSLLLIDHKQDLADLFEPRKEVIAYHSADEASELINYYLAHEDERKSIAQAGQARTLREHTYKHRMEEFVDIVSDYL